MIYPIDSAYLQNFRSRNSSGSCSQLSSKAKFCSCGLQTFKWQEYLNWKRKVNEAKASAAALKSSLGELNQEMMRPVSKWKAFFRRSHLEEVEVVKNNIYDKGLLQNVSEIVIPLSTRRSFIQRKSKSGQNCQLVTHIPLGLDSSSWSKSLV